ncbi:DUF3365 domain-containing protein [Alteromonas sp. D210916BOD_24]|uniref:Tll0287-like domain-containing protein n=1 Tax=Alteromonas sp. D210916BOD_24 TaxID=3157618 RepID=UPI00399CF378
MKKEVIIVTLNLAMFSAHLTAETQMDFYNIDASEVQIKVKEARSHAKALGSALKSRLQQAIQTGGLEAGVKECQLAAEPIANQLSQNGWQVGRTALKVRNSNNAPDKWESEQLALFSNLLTKANADNSMVNKPLESYQYNSDSGEFRYMMAIEQGQICMACHGEQITPSVKQTILQYYPDDQATGFKLGELRGAFTLSYKP